jgi:hypothetical protein
MSLTRHVDAAAGLGDALELADDRAAFVVLQADLEGRVAVSSVVILVAADVAFVGQHIQHAARSLEAGVITVDLPRICALRMRVSISPIGSFIS